MPLPGLAKDGQAGFIAHFESGLHPRLKSRRIADYTCPSYLYKRWLGLWPHKNIRLHRKKSIMGICHVLWPAGQRAHIVHTSRPPLFKVK